MGKGLLYVEVPGGVSFVAMYILLFLHLCFFVVLCVCFDLWRCCLSAETFFFQSGFCLWLVSYLNFTFGDNFAIHMMLCRLICLFMLIFFSAFLSWNF